MSYQAAVTEGNFLSLCLKYLTDYKDYNNPIHTGMLTDYTSVTFQNIILRVFAACLSRS